MVSSIPPQVVEPMCFCGHPKHDHAKGRNGCQDEDCDCDRFEPGELDPGTEAMDPDENLGLRARRRW